MDAALVSEQRIVELPAADAAANLPAAVVEGGVTLHIERSHPSPGTATTGSRRFPATWVAEHGRGQGYVEVGPLSARMAFVEVAVPREATRGHAETLRNDLEGRPHRPPTPARPPQEGRRLVAVGGLLVVLVAAAVPGFHLLTRPQPVSVETATVVEWACKAGQKVEEGDPLLSVELDKIDSEITAPVSGTVVELTVEPGADVSVGTILCILDT
jgi:glutaconyl-CoA/methylmalonyl-CoA decarboxylase subunit gamma